MPIYEYKCKQCGSHIEKRQAISDAPLKICEECGGSLEKLWSRSGFQFKGDGWYVTDYSKKSSGGSDSEKTSTTESTTKPEAASNPKSETPAAAKPDGKAKKD